MMANPNQPPSFKTNVHRAPTKKWADAKSYSYSGDDWGEYDEFDEYGTHDDPAPPARPTGLRQRGQDAAAAATTHKRFYSQNQDSQPSSQAPLPQTERSSYLVGEDMRGFPRQAMGKHSSSTSSGASSPGKSRTPPTSERMLQDRLSAGTFSDPARRQQGFRQPSPPNTHQTRAGPGFDPETQTFGPGEQFDRSSPFQASRLDEVPEENPPSNDGPSDSGLFNRVSQDTPPDLRMRQDFVPAAMPPALSSRPTPADSSAATEHAPDNRFPPRKSSLTSQVRPDIGSGQEQKWSTAPPAELESTNQPDQELDDDLSDAVTPHFIRPADIYRRMEQERARESRSQSQESDRRAIDRGKAEAPGSVQISQPVQEPQPIPSLHVPTLLEPVPERKSEYGMESVVRNPSATVEKLDLETTEKAPVDMDDYLPKFDRFSGLSSFGADMWNLPPTNDISASTENNKGSAGSQKLELPSSELRQAQNIHSTVTTAFEREHESSIPETPISGTGTDESGNVSRSNTDSTAGISPIMNDMRGQSFRGREKTFMPPQPTIAENVHQEDVTDSRPLSSDTLTGQHIPGETFHSEAVIGVPQNYRRHSPGHSLSIETQALHPESEEGSVIETPMNASQEDQSSADRVSAVVEDYQQKGFDHYETREADLAAAVNSSPEQEVHGVADAVIDAQKGFLRQSIDASSHMPPLADPQDPYSSHTGKDSHSPEYTHAGTDEDSDAQNRGQPGHGNSESLVPRPGLPGEWISYSSVDSEEHGPYLGVDDYVDDDDDDNSIVATPKGMRARSPARPPSSGPNFAPRKPSTTATQVNEPDPSRMAALAAASAAMAASMKGNATGLQNQGKVDTSLKEKSIPPLRVPGPNTGPTPPANISGAGAAVRTSGYLDTTNMSVPSISPPVLPDDTGSKGDSNVSLVSDESPFGDTENDMLSREIVRSLTPQAPENVAVTRLSTGEREQNKLGVPDSPSADSMRASTLIPREYDSYWASGGPHDGTSPRSPLGETLEVAPELNEEPRTAQQTEKANSGGRMLTRRFSWESEGDEEGNYDGYEQSKDLPGAGLGIETSAPLAQEQVNAPEFAKRDTYALLGTAPIITEPEPPSASKDVVMELPVVEKPRDSLERPKSDTIPINRNARPISQAKSMPFREVMALKSSAERQQAIKGTREEFAGMHTGLSDWLGYMVTSHPEHLRGAPIPTINTTGLNDPARGKFSPTSGKAGGKGGPSAAQQPYYMQYLDSAAQVPGSGSGQNAAEGSPGGGNFFGKGRTSSGQMQAKGKDMLHSAGVFSGKAAMGAKGLFNRGKNRFKAATQDKGE